MHYYQFHISDFRAGTVNFSRLERWIYRDLLDIYYDTERPLPADIGAVCRLAGARTEAECDAVDFVLRSKFMIEDDGWHHERCDGELARYKAKQVIAQAKGAMGGTAKASRRLATASPQLAAAKPQLSPRLPNQQPTTSNQQPVNKKEAPEPIPAPPEWVNADDWQAYAESRKRLRKPMTAAAARLVFRELTKIRDSGLDPDEALRNSVMNGWVGVFPPKPANQGATHGNSQRQKFNPYESIRRAEAALARGVGAPVAEADVEHLRPPLPIALPGR